jgi:ABC-2 type transport system permease protein
MSEFLHLLAAISLIFLSTFAYFFMLTFCEMIAFWADNTWTLGVMLRFLISFFGGAFLPLAFFPQWAQEILHFLPFASMISVPVQLLLGKLSWDHYFQSLMTLLFWLPLLFLAVKQLWQKGTYQYTGVGM